MAGGNWTEITSPVAGLERIVYGNGIYMATNRISGNMSAIYSEDGILWNTSPLPTGTAYVLDIAYHQEYFYYITNTSTYRTKNFTNWENKNAVIPFSTISSSLGNLFGCSSGSVYKLQDDSWTELSLKTNGIAGDDGFFIMRPRGDNESILFTTDMENFNRYDIGYSANIAMCAYNGNNVIVTGPTSSMAVETITLVDEPTTPSEALISIVHNIENIPQSVVDELASMIRSGVESTLV